MGFRVARKIISLVMAQVFLVTNIGWTAPSDRSLFKNKRPDYKAIQERREGTMQKKKDVLSGKEPAKRSTYDKDYSHRISLAAIKDLSSIYVPDELGKIVEVYQAENPRPLIVHIQDLHTNPEGQFNEASILEILVKDYKLDLICSEGAEGEVDTSSVSSFPDREVREKTARLFVNSGELTAEEYLSITKYPDLPIWGVEDKDIYFQNIIEFNKIMKFNPDSQVFIQQVKDALERLKPRVYSKRLLEVDAKEKEYEDGTIETGEYIDYLFELDPAGIGRFKNIGLLKETMKFEKGIDKERIMQESQDLLINLQSVLRQKQNKSELDTLLGKATLFKEQRITPFSFYSYLDELARRHLKEDLEGYANLIRFVEYLKKVNSLDSIKLFNEIEELACEAKDALSENQDQKLLTRSLRHIKFLENFFNLKVSNEELDYYLANKEGHKVRFFERSLKKNFAKYNMDSFVDFNPGLIDERLEELEDFYEIAKKRDIAMIHNALSEIERRNAKLTALIAGGFHTRGFTKLLKEKDYSYVVIAPYSATEIDEENYQFLLSGKRKPLSELIEGLDKQLRVPLANSGEEKEEFSSRFLGKATRISFLSAGEIAQEIWREAESRGEELPDSRLNHLRESFERSFGTMLTIRLLSQEYMNTLGAKDEPVIRYENNIVIAKEYYAENGFADAVTDEDALAAAGEGRAIMDPLLNILAHEKVARVAEEKGIEAEDLPMLAEGVLDKADYETRRQSHLGGDVDQTFRGRKKKDTKIPMDFADKAWLRKMAEKERARHGPKEAEKISRRDLLKFMLGIGALAAGGRIAYELGEAPKEIKGEREYLMQTLHKDFYDTRSHFSAQVRYLQASRNTRKNLLSAEDMARVESFLMPSRVHAIRFAAKEYDLEPELIAGFIYEAKIYQDSENSIKRTIKEFISSAFAELDMKNTCGIGNTSTIYMLKDRSFLDIIYENRKFFLKLLKDKESISTFNRFIDAYGEIIEIRHEPSWKAYVMNAAGGFIGLVDKVEPIGILYAAYIMREGANEIEKRNRNETDIPDTSVMKRHSRHWTLRDREKDYKPIPDIYNTRYGKVFNQSYYPPYCYQYFAAADYTGVIVSRKGQARARGKIKAYLMFLRSSIFKAYDEQQKLGEIQNPIGDLKKNPAAVSL